MDPYSKYHFYLALFSMVVSLAAMIHSLWSNRAKAVRAWFEGHDKRLEKLENKVGNMPNHCTGHISMVGRLDGHNDRLAQHKEMLMALETELKHLPKTGDIEKIYERINQVSTQLSDLKVDMGKVSGAMPGIAHTTEMMNEFLLNQGR